MFNKLLDPEGSKLPRLSQLGPQVAVEVERLWALVEQLLEHARLVRPTFGYSGQVACDGWATTRLARSALAAGTVQSALGQSLAQR